MGSGYSIVQLVGDSKELFEKVVTRCTVYGPLAVAQSVKLFVCCVYTQQRGPMMVGPVKQQISKTIYFVNARTPLSSGIPVLAQWVHIQSHYNSKGMEGSVSSSMGLTSPRPVWLYLVLSVQSAKSRSQY